MSFESKPIKVFGNIVGWSTEPTPEELTWWSEFEIRFPHKEMLADYKTIYMKELDSEARKGFIQSMTKLGW